MFEDFRIKLLQREIISRGKHEDQMHKSAEELTELLHELQYFNLSRPFKITNTDLKKVLGNMQKEIADVENIIHKLKMMFVQTPEQKREYKAAKRRIIRSLKIYLKAK